MSATLTAFKALVRKDIALFLRDRRALVVSVLTPIVVADFFGFLFGGTGAGGNPAGGPGRPSWFDGLTMRNVGAGAIPSLLTLSLSKGERRNAFQFVTGISSPDM